MNAWCRHGIHSWQWPTRLAVPRCGKCGHTSASAAVADANRLVWTGR